MTAVTASSATAGFFQPKPKVLNQYHEDTAYNRTLQFLLPAEIQAQTATSLSDWGAKVLSPQILKWNANAEAVPPQLHLRDTFGSPRNELITSEGWRNLQDLGLREGIVATAYEGAYGPHSRLVQFAKIFLWNGSSSTVTCPSAMQDGAAALIKLLLAKPDDGSLDATQRRVLESAYRRLTSRDPAEAWTSGQWMTERTGGSDVRGTETRARKATEAEIKEAISWTASDGSELGSWIIDGFKWFSSATDANMAVLLAKTEDSDNLSLFFAPTRRQRPADDSNGAEPVTEFNGIFPQRLKNKLGTKALPTAELELKGMRAYKLGQDGKGTKEISTVLNITRIYNAVSSVGGLGRGLAISRAFARVRKTAGGRLLLDVPAHVRGMADVHVQYRADMALSFFVVSLLGITETTAPVPASEMPLLSSKTQAAHLLRLLTPVTKAMTALNAIAGLRFCMESMGGVGYLEDEIELNVAKLFRDANVLAIWEGTTDVLAADTVRIFTGPRGGDVLNAFGTWAHDMTNSKSVRALRTCTQEGQAESSLDLSSVDAEIKTIRHMLAKKKAPELLYCGRELLTRIHWVVCTALLVADAARDQDPTALEVTKRWAAKQDAGLANELKARPWETNAAWDKQIVFGDGTSSNIDATAKL